MKLETIKLSELNPAEYNPRTITKEEFEGLKKSLETFGQQENLIVNKDMTVISGHQRLEAMKALGWTEAVCNMVDLDKHQEKKLNVIMNSTAISGKYDDLKLSEILEELKLDDDYNDLRLDKLEPLDLSDTSVKGSLATDFVVPPFSVLNTVAGEWQDRKKNWMGLIADKGESREKTLSDSELMSGINSGVSILDAVLAELVVKWFGLPMGKAFDPFAGDTVFGYVAASLGMDFTGIELRQEQVTLNQARVDSAKLQAKYICDDALNSSKYIKPNSQDLIFSCPPYADLEEYSNLPNDISNMSHKDFYKVYTQVLANTFNLLKPNRFAVITVAEVRNKQGEYINLVPKTIDIMVKAGYIYYNEIILVNSCGTLPQRVRRYMRNRKIGSRHQNMLVFYKGDIKKIKDNYPEIKFENIENETTDF